MSDPRIEDLIISLRDEADSTHFMHLAEPAIAVGIRRSPWARLTHRAAAVAASAFIVVGGLGGVAYAANGAAPGDFLYGLDRALESVGIGNGGSAERIAEVRTLLGSGEIGRGLEHAADHIPDPAAKTALQDAADRVADTDAPDGVPPLLSYLSEHTDSVDGSVVADLARQIGNRPDDLPAPGQPDDPGRPDDVPGPPSDTPGGPPESVPGSPTGTPNGPPAQTP